MKVALTSAAEADLERIGDAIARDKPRRAVSFVAELKARCESLGEAPEAFPLISLAGQVGIRRRVHGNYLIFYKQYHDRVVVLRVLHGAMNYQDHLLSNDGEA